MLHKLIARPLVDRAPRLARVFVDMGRAAAPARRAWAILRVGNLGLAHCGVGGKDGHIHRLMAEAKAITAEEQV